MKRSSSFWKKLSGLPKLMTGVNNAAVAKPSMDATPIKSKTSKSDNFPSNKNNSDKTTRGRESSLTHLMTQSVTQMLRRRGGSNTTGPVNRLALVKDVTKEDVVNDGAEGLSGNQTLPRSASRSSRRLTLTSAFPLIDANLEDGSSIADFDSWRSSNASSVWPANHSVNPAMDRPISDIGPTRSEGHDPYLAVRSLSGPFIAYNGVLDSRFPRFEPVLNLRTGNSYSGRERNDPYRYFRSHNSKVDDEDAWEDTRSEMSSVHGQKSVSQLVQESELEPEPRHDDNGEGPSNQNEGLSGLARGKKRAITPPNEIEDNENENENENGTNDIFFGSGIPTSPPNHTAAIQGLIEAAPVEAAPIEARIRTALAEPLNAVVEQRDRLLQENNAYEHSLRALHLLMQEQAARFTQMQNRLREKQGELSTWRVAELRGS